MSKDHDELQKREALLKQTATEYAPYFQINTALERATFDHELESMLTRLEEYGTLLERTRGESRHNLDVLVPLVYSHYQSLQQTFQTVDRLSSLVEVVKRDLTTMEATVAQAEADLGLSQSFTTVIKPLFFMREHIPAQLSPQARDSFKAPEIFHTEDYFETTITDAVPPTDPQ